MSARILIVEDETIVQFDLQQRLERMGYSVVGLASRGDEAVAKAVELKPDLVLMDVRLDGPMDGIEAARQIRARQGTPVVYLTAYAATLEESEPQDVFGPFLSKPFRTHELQSTLARILDGPRPAANEPRT
jgi:two-component system, sensor histidine kinase